MFNSQAYFDTVYPVLDANCQPIHVELGDGRLVTIKGYSKTTFKINNRVVSKYGYLIPSLRHSLLLINNNLFHPGCYFHSKANISALAFPTFTVNLIADPEVSIPIHPVTSFTVLTTFDNDQSCLTSLVSFSKNHPKHANLDQTIFTSTQQKRF